jgi:hypothetical protein
MLYTVCVSRDFSLGQLTHVCKLNHDVKKAYQSHGEFQRVSENNKLVATRSLDLFKNLYMLAENRDQLDLT